MLMLTCVRLLELHQISHTPSMVAKRGLTNQANVHTPKSFKTARQNTNWSSNFGCSWTSFHSNQKIKIKNVDAQVWGDTRGPENGEYFGLWFKDTPVVQMQQFGTLNKSAAW